MAAMLRTLAVDTPAGSVSARLAGEPGDHAVLLAHGAGVPQDHPWMVTVRDGLAAAGHPTMTFNYRYAEAGRKAPDRLPTLLDVHRGAAQRLAALTPRVILAGKSMGGRVASHLAAEDAWPAAALVYYGYPLVPMGRGEPRDVDHLARIAAPQLFFAGTRDRLSPPELVARVVADLPHARLVVVDDADHSFVVPKRAGRTHEEVLAAVVADTAAFLEEVLQTGGGR